MRKPDCGLESKEVPRGRRFAVCAVPVLLAVLASSPQADAQKKPKSYRLPPVDLKQQVIWGSTCDGPDGTGLAFGGQDQKSDDGIGHTRIKVNGEWKDIHKELRKKNPLQKYHERLADLARKWRAREAKARSIPFRKDNDNEQSKQFASQVSSFGKILEELGAIVEDLSKARDGLKGYDSVQAERVKTLFSNEV